MSTVRSDPMTSLAAFGASLRTGKTSSDTSKLDLLNALHAAGLQHSIETALPARILIVDDEPLVHELLQRLCDTQRFVAIHARNGEEALEIIRRQPVDVVISDVCMPVMDGLELCRRIKASQETALLPVLLLSALGTTEDRIRGFDAGGDEYMAKPFHGNEILSRLRGLLRTRFLQGQLENAEQVIFTLARAVEAKDSYTAGHIERVSTLVVCIGREFRYDQAACGLLYRGGILHDIGKIGVPDSVLNKPGKLTPTEFEQIKRHAHIGESICRTLKTLQPVLDLIRHHHEHLDGSGYPDGLSGAQVSQPARIMAVCDVYDALTSHRPYRKAMDRVRALDVLREGVGAGRWDGEIVECLDRVTLARPELSPTCP